MEEYLNVNLGMRRSKVKIKVGLIPRKENEVLISEIETSSDSFVFRTRLYLHVGSSYHIVPCGVYEWWPAAAARADETTACGEEPMTGGRAQYGTPTRLGFLHEGRRTNRR